MKSESNEPLVRDKEKERFQRQFDLINESLTCFVSLANNLANNFRDLDKCYTEDCDLKRESIEKEMTSCYSKLRFELKNLETWEKGLKSFLSKK